MDAFAQNQLSVRTNLDWDGFFNLLDWFRTQVRDSSPLNWIELREYSSSKVIAGGTLVLIYIDPAKAVLHKEAWDELLVILGFKKDLEERILFAVEHICTKCGAHSKIEARFCSICGTSLELAKVSA